VNPCASVHCEPGEECDINKFGIARCECPPQCEPVMRPVCAQDGRTYESLCELRRASCEQKKLIEVKYTGACGKSYHCAVCLPHNTHNIITSGKVCLRSEDAFVITCVANLMEVKVLYVQRDLQFEISSYWRLNV
jgi:coxsackievirus/adenovirus receptor